MRHSIMILMLLITVLPVSVRANKNQRRQIPIMIEARPVAETLESGKPLLLRITISNGLPQEIRFSTFSLTPNSWGGETTNISLLDIYREPRSKSVFYARPKLGEEPRYVEGMAGYRIKPREALPVIVDMNKWQIVDG